MSIRAVPLSLLLSAAVVAGFLLAAYGYPLRLPDEPRVAHTGYEMGRTSDWLLPRVNGEEFLQTPPLYYDLLSLWFRCAGSRPEGNARIPSLLFTIGTVYLVARRARQKAGQHGTPLFTAAVLVTTAQFFEIGHTVVVEPALVFFSTLAVLELEEILVAERVRIARSVLLGVATGGAFLVKGLPGPLLIGVVTASAAALSWRLLVLRPLLVGLLIAAAVAALTALPWLVTFSSAHPGLLRTLLLDHVVSRVLEAEGGKDPSNFTFLHRTLANLLPWTILLPFVLWASIAAAFPRLQRRAGEARPPAERVRLRLRLCWALVPLALLFLSESKRNLYLSPLLPAFALLTAGWMIDVFERSPHRRVVSVLYVLCAVAAVTGLAALPIAGWLGAGEVRVAMLLAAAPLALVCVAALLKRWSDDSMHRRLTLCLLVIAVASWGTTRHLAREGERSLSDLGDALARLAADGHEVIGYRLSEREIGAVAWGLRRPFPHCESEETLAAALAEARSPLVVGEREDLASESLPEIAAAPVRAEKELRRRTLEVRELEAR